jgi:hypothetical protein
MRDRQCPPCCITPSILPKRFCRARYAPAWSFPGPREFFRDGCTDYDECVSGDHVVCCLWLSRIHGLPRHSLRSGSHSDGFEGSHGHAETCAAPRMAGIQELIEHGMEGMFFIRCGCGGSQQEDPRSLRTTGVMCADWERSAGARRARWRHDAEREMFCRGAGREAGRRK